jgi:hypothetical protein
MMMPERNQKLGERDDQFAAEDQYPRSEQTTADEQQRGADEMRSDARQTEEVRSDQPRMDETRTDEMGFDETRTDEMRSGEMPAQGTTPPAQTASDPTRSEEQVAGEQFPGQQSSGQQGAQATDGQRERLVPADHAASYASRWDAVKGTFVDEPREAVAQADALVGELLEELEMLFREQRRDIERGLDADETSTEDLRMALRRYRSFFDRLLAL